MESNAKWENGRRISFQGIKVNALSDEDVVALVTTAIGHDSRYVLGNHNAHSIYLCGREPQMQEFYSMADFVTIDGMSIILLGRLVGLPLKRRDRAAHLDFMPLLLAEAKREGWRIYYLGSRPGVSERGAAMLREQHPGLQIRTHHGYFNSEKSNIENREVLIDIDAYKPQILLVGMGMPRQERWILENREEIAA